MLARNHGYVFSLRAGGNISPGRILKFGSADDQVLQATAAADLSIGVSYVPRSEIDPIPVGQAPNPVVVAGEMVDVVTSGLAEVDYGDTITRGQRLTSDANGKAVPATAGDIVIGIAGMSGADGDLGSVLIAPGQVDTPPA